MRATIALKSIPPKERSQRDVGDQPAGDRCVERFADARGRGVEGHRPVAYRCPGQGRLPVGPRLRAALGSSTNTCTAKRSSRRGRRSETSGVAELGRQGRRLTEAHALLS